MASNYTFQNGDVYPILPTSHVPIEWELRHRHRVLRSEARNQRYETRQVGGARIEGSFKFSPMLFDECKDLLAFLREVEGGGTIFALRIPTMSGGAYTASLTEVGEYYNLSRTAGQGDNALVQYLGSGPLLSPEVRDGGATTLAARTTWPPTLKCSLKGPVQTITYPGDSIIRVEIDVVERW